MLGPGAEVLGIKVPFGVLHAAALGTAVANAVVVVGSCVDVVDGWVPAAMMPCDGWLGWCPSRTTPPSRRGPED